MTKYNILLLFHYSSNLGKYPHTILANGDLHPQLASFSTYVIQLTYILVSLLMLQPITVGFESFNFRYLLHTIRLAFANSVVFHLETQSSWKYALDFELQLLFYHTQLSTLFYFQFIFQLGNKSIIYNCTLQDLPP